MPMNPHRKLGQLCAQASEAIQFALSECADARLQVLEVVSVTPAPDESQLEVLLAAPAGTGGDALAQTQAQVAAAAHILRAAVAAAVTRRKAPQLVLRLASPDEKGS